MDGKIAKCNCRVPSSDARREYLRLHSWRGTEEVTTTIFDKNIPDFS